MLCFPLWLEVPIHTAVLQNYVTEPVTERVTELVTELVTDDIT